MAHIETKDPFGFVGYHVVRRQPRKGGEEHGWLTRYDETLDCYTLFVPGGGEPRLVTRAEVMKFLSAPNIDVRDDDQEEFPPPIKDFSTSRYLGVQLRRPRASNEYDSSVDEDLRGHVKCFLPFGDRYCIEYEDGSTEEMSESAVIDGMISLNKSPFFSSPSRKKQSGSLRTRSIDDLDGDAAVSARRKRRRVEVASDDVEEIPAGSVAVVENTDESNGDDVLVVDQTEGANQVESAPNILEIMNVAMGSSTNGNSLEMASHPEDEPVQVDDGEVADQDDGVEIVEDPKNLASAVTGATTTEDAAEEAGKDVPFYIIDKKPHEATEPLPKRALAFELLRASLLNVLDRREANSVKIALQYDILRNPDVRDRDAVIRFMNADGLIVLNHLLNSFATDVLDDEEEEESKKDPVADTRERMERDDELLHILKIVAMLPTPGRNQVIDSNIGKTIGYLSKKRGPPGRNSPLPKCITALAKWIKSSWIKNIPKASKTSPKALVTTPKSVSRPQQQARRGGRGGSAGRSGRGGRPGLQSYQPPPSQRLNQRVSSVPRTAPQDQRVVDNTPIPRLPRPTQDQPVAAPSQPPVPRRATGGLKPDWMRQKESLSRSRFCIPDNTNADMRLYRDRRRPVTNVPVVPPPQPPEPPNKNQDQHEDAGGPDGVFGRPQRLRFGKRWNTQEFGIKDPPGTLRQPPGSYPIPAYSRSQY
eukprot:jgi/Phyca11/574894/estExt2_Genewise1.C_PHYCAscaffold_660114